MFSWFNNHVFVNQKGFIGLQLTFKVLHIFQELYFYMYVRIYSHPVRKST